jgi:hypothetical protein
MTVEIIYKHTPDMGEISGFGGGYEDNCQQMLHNGVKFLVELAKTKSTDDIDFTLGQTSKDSPIQLFGVCDIKGEDGKALEKAVMEDIGDATGAMHHTVMQRLLFIAGSGWDAYCEELKKSEAKNIDE